MTKTLADQADAITFGTDTFVLVNEEIRAGFKEALCLAAVAFEDDGSMPEPDQKTIDRIRPTTWPTVARLLDLGLIHGDLAPPVRDQWRKAVSGACRVIGTEFPPPRSELDALIPF